MNSIRKLFGLLDNKEIKKVKVLFLMTLVMSVLDALGVASILPFISVLSNPEIVNNNIYFKSFFEWSKNFGVITINDFLFFLGLCVFFVLIFSLCFKALTNYFHMRYIYLLEYSIGKRLIESYLSQPYSWFLSRNSSELGKNILSEVGIVILQGMLPIMNIITNSAIATAIFILLLLNNVILTLGISLIFFIVYLLIYRFLREFLKKIGNERLKNNNERFRYVNEAFNAIKEIKVNSIETIFINRFSKPAEKYAKNIASAQLISVLPRYLVEVIAFGGILSIPIYLLFRQETFKEIIPILALYSFAGYRLLPSLQQIYAGLSRLRFVEPALNYLYKNMINKKVFFENISSRLQFNNEIEIKNLFYKHPNKNNNTLENINLKIKAGSKVAFVGLTGSGKTTLIDIMLFLLDFKIGTFKVDGKEIDKSNFRSWQNIIGYVPQNIYLNDDTIRSNIGFGVERDLIIEENIEQSSKIAEIYDFIKKDFPEGFDTMVGERGVRLSGGQRQRLGIARALYSKPEILIFDEATSALDNITERKIMSNLSQFYKKKTIIVIAHRVSTVKDFDDIFIIDNGKVVANGTYEYLVKNNEKFNLMANNQLNLSKTNV